MQEQLYCVKLVDYMCLCLMDSIQVTKAANLNVIHQGSNGVGSPPWRVSHYAVFHLMNILSPSEMHHYEGDLLEFWECAELFVSVQEVQTCPLCLSGSYCLNRNTKNTSSHFTS